jgi:tRNA/tmRNA/rRNA uracil-C5-methylase (TrmA/RlmC/RlmD family)
VARHDGRVVFVRHALPGERVRVVVTEGGTGDRFLRADAVEVLVASPDRVERVCRHAGPPRSADTGCGGCDWQHASPAAQRALKAAVVREQLVRLAGVDIAVSVEPVPGDADGLGWRTRVELAVGPDGRAGLRRHRSHDVVAIVECPIAHPQVLATGVLQRDWTGRRAVDVIVPDRGSAVVVPVPADGSPTVTQVVTTARWSARLRVAARSFWQVHPGAAGTFVDRVLADLAPRPGERVLDLYAGVGLFALALADAVGPRGSVTAVESDERAVADGIRNAGGRPQVTFVAARVEDAAATLPAADLVVLDPPRTGAGRAVMAAVTGLRPRAISYVACDPASLARDVRYAAEAGYGLSALHAYDAFPMTHHVECVALLTPTGA